MNTAQALLVYLIVCIFIFALFINIRIRVFSAIVLTLLIGQILLNILCPPSQISPWSPTGESITSSSAIYVLIQIATPVVVLVYVIMRCWVDRLPKTTNTKSLLDSLIE